MEARSQSRVLEDAKPAQPDSLELLDLMAHQDPQDRTASQVAQASQERVEIQDHQAQPATLAHQDSPEARASQADLVSQARREDRDSPDRKDHQDQPVSLDSPDRQDNRHSQERRDHQAHLDQPASQETPALQDSPEALANPASQAMMPAIAHALVALALHQPLCTHHLPPRLEWVDIVSKLVAIAIAEGRLVTRHRVRRR